MSELSPEDQELVAQAIAALHSDRDTILSAWRRLAWAPAWIATGATDKNGYLHLKGIRTVILTDGGTDHDLADFICFSSAGGFGGEKIGHHWPHRNRMFDDMIRIPQDQSG